jgi:hypothetical protein
MKRPGIQKLLPFILMITPILLFIVLFVLAAVAMEGADTFGTGDKTSGQQASQTFADVAANGAAFTFVFLIPIGLLSGILLIIARALQKKKHER